MDRRESAQHRGDKFLKKISVIFGSQSQPVLAAPWPKVEVDKSG